MIKWLKKQWNKYLTFTGANDPDMIIYSHQSSVKGEGWLNIFAGLCILSFGVAGIWIIVLLVDLWNRRSIDIVIIISLVIAGFIFKSLVSKRERKIKWEREQEAQKAREKLELKD